MPGSKTEVWIDWALQKAERLPVIGERVANYRQERVWNNPSTVAAHDEWGKKVIENNDRYDRLYGDGPEGPAGGLDAEDQVVVEITREVNPERATAESDREWMSPEEWKEAYHDSSNDRAEAYADVAGDATLSWRLEEEDPRDILDDVRREAARRAGLLQPDADHGGAGGIENNDPRDPGDQGWDDDLEPDWEALTEKLDGDRTRTETLGRDDQDRLHRDPREGPAQITFTESFGGDFYNRTELYVVHGELLARAEFHSGQDEEGSWYRETWFDREGNKHSFNGNPAEIRRSNHYIPEETYLDESVVEFSDHGTFVDSIDQTYEDVVSHKPLAVRQAFGYDIDGPEPEVENALPKFGGRFDNWDREAVRVSAVDLLIIASTDGLKREGFAAKEVSPEKDNAPERGVGR